MREWPFQKARDIRFKAAKSLLIGASNVVKKWSGAQSRKLTVLYIYISAHDL